MSGKVGMRRGPRINQRIPLPEDLRAEISEDEWNTYSRWKRYNLRNPEKIKLNHKNRRIKNLKENPDYDREIYLKYFKHTRKGNWRRHLRYKYNLTEEEYLQKFENQQGLCAICKQPESAKYKGTIKKLGTDHSHKTGKVRDLLCQKHNHLLADADDDIKILQEAINYLGRHQDE